jgi:exosortase
LSGLPARFAAVLADRAIPVALGLVVVATIGWLYAATGTALVSEWLSSADDSYGIALVAVALVLVWHRQTLFLSRRNPSSPPAIGITTLLCGLMLYITGMLGADVFLTRVSSVIVMAGTMCFLAGPAATRVMAAPLIFTLLAIPPPALIVTTMTLPLQFVASRIAETTLMVAGVPVVRDGNLLRLPSATLEIAQACSGLRSLSSLTAIAVLLSWATASSWTRRAIVVAAAVPVAVFVNGLRVALTGLACEVWGRAAAADPWHTLTGWLTFATSVALLLSVQRLVGSPRARADGVRAAMVRA